VRELRIGEVEHRDLRTEERERDRLLPAAAGEDEHTLPFDGAEPPARIEPAPR